MSFLVGLTAGHHSEISYIFFIIAQSRQNGLTNLSFVDKIFRGGGQATALAPVTER